MSNYYGYSVFLSARMCLYNCNEFRFPSCNEARRCLRDYMIRHITISILGLLECKPLVYYCGLFARDIFSHRECRFVNTAEYI